MIFCHSFVSDVILRRFFTKPRLILACDKCTYMYNSNTAFILFYHMEMFHLFLCAITVLQLFPLGAVRVPKGIQE
jgi:hypothetical protein